MAKYDVKFSFAKVGMAGNAGVAIRGFIPPTRATIPADPLNPPAVAPVDLDTTSELLFNYQVVGGVPYEYEIGQFEITVDQYCAFLNTVDPQGENKQQPWTKVKLWNEKNNPLVNPFQGQLLYVDNAKNGRHYAVADPLWAKKPVMYVNGFQYAYFINSLTNGKTVAVEKSKQESPLGFDIDVYQRYFRFSTTIDLGSYALNDSNYAFLARQGRDGLYLPTQNEWIKAAYYAGRETSNKTSYYYFPTSGNRAPLPLFTEAGKSRYESSGDAILAAKSSNAVVNVTDSGDVLVSDLKKSVIRRRGYANYDMGVNWQPWYAPTSYKKANVTTVGQSSSPSPWLAYDMGGNVVEYTDTIAGALDVQGAENIQSLPVGFRAHGGIANATGYQLWITATGAGDPYGQQLGSGYEYGGARLVYEGEHDLGDTDIPELKRSAKGDPLTGLSVVTRADSIQTGDTHYSTNLGTTIELLFEDDGGYVSMPSSFYSVKKRFGGKKYFSMTHDATDTSYYVRGKKRMLNAMETGDYSNPTEAFRALKPGKGTVDFMRYHNPANGAYGFSDLKSDVALFEIAGYQPDGIAWSV